MQELKRELDRKVENRRLHSIRYKDYLKLQQQIREETSQAQRPRKRVKTEVASDKKTTKKEEL